MTGETSKRAPYVEALLEVSKPIRERFFFPGHSGGAFADDQLSQIVGATPLKYDLPELDGLDNIHNPEVYNSHDLPSSNWYIIIHHAMCSGRAPYKRLYSSLQNCTRRKDHGFWSTGGMHVIY
jgi:hypothetical protein